MLLINRFAIRPPLRSNYTFSFSPNPECVADDCGFGGYRRDIRGKALDVRLALESINLNEASSAPRTKGEHLCSPLFSLLNVHLCRTEDFYIDRENRERYSESLVWRI